MLLRLARVLQEPITFAPAQKPQFMKLLFHALAEATKAKAAAAVTVLRHGGKAGRYRRPGRNQQQREVQRDKDCVAAEPIAAGAIAVGDASEPKEHADKENAATPGDPAINERKLAIATMQEAAIAACNGQ